MQKPFHLFFLLVIHFVAIDLLMAQDPIPSWVIGDWEQKTRGEGVWVADNSKYMIGDQPMEAYGIQWQWGLGKKSLTGRLYGIRGGKESNTIWTFLEFWDIRSQELKLIQNGSDGTVGQGNIWLEPGGVTKSLQTFTRPDRSSFVSGHQSKNVEGELHISSFNVINGEWAPRRSYVWKNTVTSKKEVATPEEYKPFEFFIGAWQYQLDDGRWVEMSFDWAQNKLLIHYKSTNPAQPGDPVSHEVEGIIAYHGVKEQLVFMSAYLDYPPTLMNQGYFNFPEEGVVERIFTVFYQEGAGIPWTEGETAPKGGKPVNFKQVWNKVDDNSFSGEFFWDKDGSWVHPYPPKDGKKELWKRVRQ